MKKNRSIFIHILLAVLALDGCKKDRDVKNISTSGVVLNEQTGQPIADVKITLKQTNGSSSIGGSGGWATIDTKLTDSNGHFSFSEDVQDLADWTININDYDSKYSTTTYEVQPNANSFQTIYLYRNAFLNVIAQTTNPLSSNDKFYMMLPGIGCNCFHEMTSRAKGGAYNKIFWTVIRNNITQNFEDSVYCPVDTVKYYTINY
jgi:5-hydroxyisourate hydrolase-like protein (transthyretin family)